MSSQSHPILIVGAGPTGLVLALSLLQNGVPVRIIEKASKPYFGNRGSGLLPRTLEVYGFLGVLPDVLKEATPVPINRWYELPGGTKIVKEQNMSPRTNSPAGIPFFNLFTLGQDIAQSILRSHLEKYECHVEFSTELRSFEQHADHVEAHLVRAEEGNETPETLSASYVVGADGARGVVRKLLGLSFDGVTRQSDGVVFADVRMKGLSRDAWHVWGNMAKRAFTALPRFTHDDDIFWVTLLGQDVEHENIGSDPEALKAFVKEVTDRQDIEITEFLTLAYIKFNIRMATEFSRDRVFIAGDAAHVHSPTGGQGMNSSVMDAFNLAWKLSLVHKGVSPSTLLQSYSSERIPVIRKMVDLTTETLDQTIANEDSGLERGRKFYQLDVNYRGSPIVLDERNREDVVAPPPNVYTYGSLGAVKAGDRAPEAPSLIDLKSTSPYPMTSLFRLFKPYKHTVIIFAASASLADSVFDTLQEYPSDLIQTVAILPSRVAVREGVALANTDIVLKDTDGHAYEGYSVDAWAPGVTTVIVRPDGFVGGIGNGVPTAKSYFKRIFIQRVKDGLSY